jgi:metal-dependent amidase/aminoacylase/carboxypeptidase family protein
MRQQLRPTDRVHGVITDGGLKPNIIPDHTEAEFYIRAKSVAELDDVREKTVACFEGAARLSRCRLEIHPMGRPYADVLVNDAIGERYASHFESVGGRPIPPKGAAAFAGGSTDMGDVSYTVPSLHPMFAIPVTEGAGNHTPGFTACAATPQAHEATLRAAKALALTALDLYTNPALREAAREEFGRTAGK